MQDTNLREEYVINHTFYLGIPTEEIVKMDLGEIIFST